MVDAAPATWAESRPIVDLTALDRRHLHLFVAGPGMGEGLAVALPGSGWVLIDVCQLGNEGPYPQQEILAKYRAADDPILSLVLTHPHRDHVLGFSALLGAANPRDVAVTGNPPPESDLVSAVQRALAAPAVVGRTSDALLAKAVHSAVEAIRSWELRSGRKTRAMRDGEVLVTRKAVSLLCVAPDEAGIRELLAESQAAALPRRANHLSLVFEVVFGATRVVLTSDLPRVESTREEPEVPTGWNAVMERHPRLRGHHGLKISHHGSRHAVHADLIAADGSRRRAWVVTPYNAGEAKLPRADADEGLEMLLRAEPAVHLTALPVARGRQPKWAHPGRVERSEIAVKAAAGTMKTGSSILDRGRDVRAARASDPLGSRSTR